MALEKHETRTNTRPVTNNNKHWRSSRDVRTIEEPLLPWQLRWDAEVEGNELCARALSLPRAWHLAARSCPRPCLRLPSRGSAFLRVIRGGFPVASPPKRVRSMIGNPLVPLVRRYLAASDSSGMKFFLDPMRPGSWRENQKRMRTKTLWWAASSTRAVVTFLKNLPSPWSPVRWWMAGTVMIPWAGRIEWYNITWT